MYLLLLLRGYRGSYILVSLFFVGTLSLPFLHITYRLMIVRNCFVEIMMLLTVLALAGMI